jgi:glycosyltransferase involved in cell wall biosynthesis
MARIAVITSSPPLTEGGHLVIARALLDAVRVAGHEASLVTTPSNRFGRQAAEYAATWLTDVGHSGGRPIDHVVSLRYPSYAVRHPSHVCWLNHTMREYYDLWDDFSARLSSQDRIKERVRRRLIHAADTWCFRHHLQALYAQSATVRDRLTRWNTVSSEVLYPPAPPRPYRCDGYGDFIFVVSRLEPLKRIDLVLRALATDAAKSVPCVVAGTGPAENDLRALAKQLGLGGRVTFTGHISDDQLVDYLATCRAVCFVPEREDYGFVTMEAFSSSRAVLTVTDSGGPAELVKTDRNGLVVSPTPEALGMAIGAVATDLSLAQRLGRAAVESARGFTWSAVVDTLVNSHLPARLRQ